MKEIIEKLTAISHALGQVETKGKSNLFTLGASIDELEKIAQELSSSQQKNDT